MPIRSLALSSAVVLTFLASDARAQLANDPMNVAGNSASSNSTGGSVGLRSPGSLVRAGIADQQARVLSPRLSFDHINQEQEIPFQRVFYVDAVNILFENLNQVLFELGNTLLLRLGGNTQLPPTTPDTSSDESSMDNMTGDMTGDQNADGGTPEARRRPVKLVDRVLGSSRKHRAGKR